MDQTTNNQFGEDLMKSSLTAQGNLVSITKKNGERYSGILANIELVHDGPYCIWLRCAQKLDSMSQDPSARSDHPWFYDMKISSDELSHMEVCFLCQPH